MGEPAAITYKQVRRAVKDTGANVYDVWAKIGQITGAGTPGLDADGDASIDLTDVSDAKRGQIDRLLAPPEAAESDESKAGSKASTKKEGK
jgi:hypothetical protein